VLTTALARMKLSRGRITPSLIDPHKKGHVAMAEQLLALFAQAVDEEWTRGELDTQIEDLLSTTRSVKLYRGFAKLIYDKSEVAECGPLPPEELREALFRLSAKAGPLALEPDQGRPTAQDIIAALAKELGVTAEVIERGMYADLKEAHLITQVDVPSAEWLTQRYNTALVQIGLLRAHTVSVRLTAPKPERVRQLFRYIKFFQLIHQVSWQGNTLLIGLDGPTSLFKSSSKYGLQLASFFPALLLQDGDWSLEAKVAWRKGEPLRTMELDHTMALSSHYQDRGAWQSREFEDFVARWDRLKTDWVRSDKVEPLRIGSRWVMCPDLRFERDGKVVYLEFLGYWRKDYLERRLDALRQHGPGNLILAVSQRLLGQKGALSEFPGEVVPFKGVLSAKAVLKALEAVP